MINVTKSFLPPIEEYQQIVQRAWDNEWLTNRGELVVQLEKEIASHEGSCVPILMNNGTVPLQIALKILGKGGEIITTPFSYVATSAAIVWEHCTPVFVDIDLKHLTIDETKIEEAITSKTTAILATHVFGNPCHVEAIEAIAKRHSIAVIYDAAHCFGVQYKGESIFNYGDLSTCSFHATKLFHTGEGGALFPNNEALRHQSYFSHNFGHNGPLAFHGLGINGKMSELQAALGLAVLPYMDNIIKERKKVVDHYLANLDSNQVQVMTIREGTDWNYSYFPILMRSEEVVLRAIDRLAEHDILPRRYFYPSLNTIEYIHGSPMPVSEDIASRILCLPLYVGLDLDVVDQICIDINKSSKELKA